MDTSSSTCMQHRLQRLLDGGISDDERTETLAHLDTCESCRRDLEELAAGSRWWDDLRRLGEPPLGPTVSMGDDVLNENAPDSAAALDFLEPATSAGHIGRFGPYEVIELIGRGGMGIVFKAFDPALHRIVAIKVLAPELAASSAARQRFTREARAAASVVHDHVVTIHAVAEARGLPYLVMAYVKGMSLQERVDQTGPMLTTEILRIGMQAAQGLAAAHAQGLVHRDVKPSNILLENGVERVKLTDFGLARAIDDASTTQSGVVAGTPQYMSPEQARGEPVDHRADLFSLGSVLYAMCTGRSPFRAESAMAVLRRVSDEMPRPIREINPEIPEWLADLIGRLHAKNPGDRLQSAIEVAERLARHLAGQQGPLMGSPSPIGPRMEVAQATKPERRSSRALKVAIAVFVLLGVLGASDATGVTHVASYLKTVLRIPFGNGTLVVEVHDPAVRVEIDGKAISIRGAGVEEISLRPGSYNVEASRGGVPILHELVTVDRGGKRVLQVGVEGTRPTISAADPTRMVRAKEKVPGSFRSDSGLFPRIVMPDQGIECSTVAFSPDGSKLAAAYGNGTVILWNPANGRAERTLEGPLQFVSSVAFSPDGKTLASGTGYWTRQEIDGTVDFWDVVSGKHQARGTGHKGPIYNVAFSPDGRAVASGGADAIPRLWNAKDGQLLDSLPKQNDWIFAIAYAPDGKTLAIGNQMVVQLIDPTTGKVKGILEGHRGQIEAVGFSPDGKTIASAGRDRLIKLWDFATLRERATLRGHAGWIMSLAFSPTESTLAATGLEGEHTKEVRLWDTATTRLLATMPGVNSHSVAFAPDGKSLATGNLSGAVKIWNVADVLRTVKGEGQKAEASASQSN